jgi:hypothetical protein
MFATLTIKGIEYYCTCKPWAWMLLVAKITEELARELGAALLPLNLLNAFNWEARDEELRNSKVCSRFLRRMQTVVSRLTCASLRIMGVQCRSAAITDVVDSLGYLAISFGDGQTGLHFHFVVFIVMQYQPRIVVLWSPKSWWLAGGLQLISCHAPVNSVCRAWIYPRDLLYTCGFLVHAWNCV